MIGLLRGPLLRLVFAGLVLVGVQNAVCSRHPVAGVRVQLLLAMTAAAGAGSGAERGAMAGFVLGMMSDLSSGQLLGVTALSYGLGGLAAGYLRVLTPVPRWWMIAGFTALGAVVGEAAQPVLMLFAGQEGWLRLRVLLVVVVVTVAAVILAPLFVPIGRLITGFKRPQWKSVTV